MVKRAAAERKSRDDFLNTALQMMAQGRSVDAVKIDALCRQLGVSKGSFYWHFKNRDALIEALLDAWSGQFQTAVHQALEQRSSGKPEPVIEALVEFWINSDMSAIDRAMRHWAYSDERVQKAVAQADALLLKFIADNLRKLGHSSSEARRRARLLMAVGIAEPQIAHLPKVGSDRSEAAWILRQVLALD